MRQKKVYAINLYIDAVEDIKSQGYELSAYIRNLIDNDTESIEKQKERLEKMDKQREELKSIINQKEKEKEEKRKQIENLEEKEKEHFQRTKELIDKRGYSYLDPRRKAYNNDFGKNLDRKQFEEILKKVKK